MMTSAETALRDAVGATIERVEFRHSYCYDAFLHLADGRILRFRNMEPDEIELVP